MARSTASLVFLFSCLVASSLCQAGEDDGQWKDDVSGNPEVMGFDPSEQQMQFAEPIQVPVPMQAAPEFFEPSNDDDQSGAWMDDVSNNQIVMGEDPLSQDPGLGLEMSRKRRSLKLLMSKKRKHGIHRLHGKKQKGLF